ncbi:MAG TPA: hypothetical protein VEP90_13280 [Methylomirabilota bacterium]|nr:hypothetical protein [Methylomirabilota bacterium]
MAEDTETLSDKRLELVITEIRLQQQYIFDFVTDEVYNRHLS